MAICLGELSMSETSETLEQATLWDTSTFTSLQASVDSPLASNGQTSPSPFVSSLVASPVRILATPVSEQASLANEAAYGARCTVSFATFDHSTSSWRTFRLCLEGGYQEFSQTWPRAGMMRSGRCYQQKPLVPRISGRESSLWATLCASDAGGRGYSTTQGRSLVREVKMAQRLPTLL